MKTKLLNVLLEIIFFVVMFVLLVAMTILWPLIYLYMVFVSDRPVSDHMAGAAECIISLDKIFDAIRENKDASEK